MNPSILIAVFGAISSIAVALLGAWFANRNNVALQTRKLKEEHYINFVIALHNIRANDGDNWWTAQYLFARDKLFLIASKEVVKNMLAFEQGGIDKPGPDDNYLITQLIKAIRRDLKLKARNFPTVSIMKAPAGAAQR